MLTLATTAAQFIRSNNDPEKILAGAYKALTLPRPDDGDDPLALRIVRLTEAASENRQQLIDFLSKHSGPIPFNRPPQGWGGAVEPGEFDEGEPDPEAEKLQTYAEEHEDAGRDMMVNFPAFDVAHRRVSSYFGGRMFVTREGQRLTQEEAGEFREGDSIEMVPDGLPTTVRGLIDYPLDCPCLFTIEVGSEPWSIWDICSAFADQYARIYEQPERWGIWGHDLSDLVIERLLYFPKKKLIYPHVGS